MIDSPRVLIVDDEPRMCESISLLLSKKQFQTHETQSCFQALEIAAQEAFDIAILDIMMPEMDGYELMERIVRVSPDTYIIMMTGNASLESAIRALKQGAYDYLKKPFEYDQLLNTVNNALQEKRLRRENALINGRLARSEEKYEYLVKNSPDIIYTLDADGNFSFISNAVQQLLGYAPGELIGKPYSRIIAEEDLEDRKWHFRERRTGDRATNGAEIRLKVSGNGHEPENTNVSKPTFELKSTGIYEDLPSEKGRRFQGTHGVARDISQRKTLENQLQHLERMEALGTLAGGIAHNFNNLLMGIQGNASIVLLDKDIKEKHRNRLNNIVEYVQSGSELTKQLLGFARGGKYEVRPLDLNHLIQQSAELFARTRKEIKILKKLAPDLWPVEVDGRQIEQVLFNLYVNAWHAMPGGGELTLETDNRQVTESLSRSLRLTPGKYVCVAVRDTGTGIEESIMPRIFEPFFTTRDVGKGTGLGLASAFGIAKNHGGTIKVESEKGKGTVFHIYLPASGAEVPEASETDMDFLTGTETVLLVDDEQMILDVGTALLKELGYSVHSAVSGPEAVELYRKDWEKIDLVVLDLIMPEMDGGKVFNELKQINPKVKVLLSSGHGLEGRASEILNSGCNGFIQKPFNLDELSRKIREILDAGID